MPGGFNAADCKNPACGSKMDMFSKSLARAQSTGAAPPPPPPSAASLECPVDREELGRSTWDLLHTTAAYYPEAPDEAAQRAAAGLIGGLAALYPCEHCAEDFRATVEASPPALGSRTALAVWLCRQHNLVNEKLGKPLFDCDIKKLDARWRDGAPGCWTHAGETASESLGKDDG